MQSKTKSCEWPEPLCLIQNLHDHEMSVDPATFDKLCQIEDKLVPVSVVGLYRTGKSYLLNKFAGKKSGYKGFQLGSTVQAKTKGIWIWCLPHPHKADTCLALLDTEGLGDVEKGDTKNDLMLFTLAALLSSTLVYNSRGTIDQQAVDRLSFVADIAEKVKISATGQSTDDEEEDDTRLCEYFPTFVWAVRDFTLELSADGKAISADDYLESALTLKKGTSKKVTEYNLPRRCIRRYFPDRKCFVFPLPVINPSDMSRLDALSEQQLSPQFVSTATDFCNHILQTSPVKVVGGLEFNGRGFACLASQYVAELSCGRTPCIEAVVTSTAEKVNEHLLRDCAALYSQLIEKEVGGKLPVDDDNELKMMHERCEKPAHQLLKQRAMVVNIDDDLGKKLSEMIGSEYHKISDRNAQLSEKKCHVLIEKLHQSIRDKVDSNYYYRIGGYTDYQQDVAAMVREYLKAPGKGIKAMDVLDEFMSRHSSTSKGIMAVDRNLSEQQKKEEELRQQQEQLRREQEKMRRSMELAEQRARDEVLRRQEYAKSLEAKFEQERQEYKRQLSRLQPLLAREQARLKREAADEDADDMATALRHLQFRVCSPTQQQQPTRLFFI